VNGETGQVPGYPTTRLALRTWQIDKAAWTVRSLNAAGGRKASWMAKAMASPQGAWPHGRPLAARCPLAGDKAHEDPVPGADCSCGIYATTDLDIISGYLRKTSPVVGVVELGGRVIPATQGYRAAYARVAVILLLDEALTEPHSVLRRLAAAYKVPAVVPHSDNPEDYRELAGTPSLALEAEDYLRGLNGDA
jgi:hypothetical protein